MGSWIEEYDELDKEKVLSTLIQVVNHLSEYEHSDGTGINWDIIPGKK